MLIKQKVIIDRIEENFAVVLLECRSIKLDISLELLPKGAKEGTWLNLNFELDPSTTESPKEKNIYSASKLQNKNN